MLQGHGRLGHRIVGKGAAALAFDAAAARLDQRIARRRKRQLVDDDQLQRVAGHVDAFPERGRGDQHAPALTARVAGAKAVHQHALGQSPLHQHLDARADRKALRQRVANAAQRTQRGRQHHGAPAQARCGIAGQTRHVAAVRRVGRARDVGGHVQRGLARVVERAADAQHLGVLQAARLREPRQARVVAQRGRDEHPGARRPLAFRRRQQARANRIGDVERRFDQAQRLADIGPAHQRHVARRGKALGAAGQQPRALVQAHEVGRQLAHGVERGRGIRQCRVQTRQAGLPRDGLHAIGRFSRPAQAAGAAHLAHGHAQVARGHLHAAGQLRPVAQAARLLQAGTEHVAREVEQLARRQLLSEKLNARLVELVRLVEDRHANRGQQFGHARFADRQVGKEQVVVDDHHVGRHGFAPRQVDVAGAELGAVGAQAVLARAGDQRDHGRAFVQPRQFGQVTGARGFRPSLYF